MPDGVTIQLTVKNLDRRAHSFQLDSTAGFQLATALPGRETATSRVTGLSKGSYRLLIDGRDRARIVGGSQPGP